MSEKRHFLDRTNGPTMADQLPILIVGGMVGTVAIIAIAGILVAVLAMVVMAGTVAVVGFSHIKGK